SGSAATRFGRPGRWAARDWSFAANQTFARSTRPQRPAVEHFSARGLPPVESTGPVPNIAHSTETPRTGIQSPSLPAGTGQLSLRLGQRAPLIRPNITAGKRIPHEPVWNSDPACELSLLARALFGELTRLLLDCCHWELRSNPRDRRRPSRDLIE